MITQWDYFGYPELPYIILCNPDKSELFSLGLAYDTNISIRFNAMGEFSFTFPKSIDGMQTELEAYTYIQNKRVIFVENYGYFIIVNVDENLDGTTPLKTVSCQSLEAELIQKKVVAYGGTRPLWNSLSPEGTVLGDMLELAPNWSVGTIDGELLTAQRTFNISNSNVYNFLMNDVGKAFECIFIFDTVSRTISAKAIANATVSTDIFLSFDNLISNASFSEKNDEITTCLSVSGGGVLNIRSVNPLGTDKIYDFSYYKTSAWMSSGLVTAVTNWETLVDTQQPIYAQNLLLLQTYNGEKLTLNSTLATLNSDYLALEGVQKLRIEQGESYEDITVQMTAKQAEIDAQEVLISNKQAQIDATTAILTSINSAVSFSTNFTENQLLELNNFIFENTYKNENIIQTDSMSLVEVQTQSQALYDQAQNVLERVSQPRYEFSITPVNYIVLNEFSGFTSQTEVGSLITAEIQKDTFIETVLLELKFQFDNPENFSMTFSNRLRLDNANFTYSDLIGEVVKTGSTVAFDSLKWSNWENDYKDSVTSFITSALDTTVNNLISNSNQEILINQNGLRGKSFDAESGTYSPRQVWLTSNILAFSDDSFNTAKLALGQITTPTGGTAYGLIADVIIGRMLAGNSLTIENEGNNFILDSTGATLNNAKFTLSTVNTKIFIDPTDSVSFRIQKNEGGTFVDKFWVDNGGNVNFAGNLTGATGTFSGTLSASVGNIGTLVIDSQGLKTSDGINYLRGNGDLKWGGLTISGSNASFSGDIFANRIVGQVVNDQVASGLSAGKVTQGTMVGNRIYGGTASPDRVNLGVASVYSVGANLEIVTNGTISISSASGGALSAGSGTTISGGTLAIYSSNIYTGTGYGLNQVITVTTPFGTRYLTFSKGILTRYSA